jgi:homoserine O-succinyltransferase
MIPLTVDSGRRRRVGSAGRSGLRIAFVNIMPDGAFETTERQFLGLLAAGSAGVDVRVRRFTLPGIPRGDNVAAYLRTAYRPVEQLWEEPCDALILTGTEPVQRSLPDEPYWASMVEVIEWAATTTRVAMLSCLAAHAAVLAFDGLERRPLPAKYSGVFDHDTGDQHPLTAGLLGPVTVPHSRLNDLPAADLRAAGYRVLLESPVVGWSLAAVQRGRCLFALNQGHPEYAAASLLKEYRRDVRRYVDGVRPTWPGIPEGYVGEDGYRLLVEHRAAVESGARPAFPFAEVAAGIADTWRAPAERLLANWLQLAAGTESVAPAAAR